MKLISLDCPSCGSSLHIEEGHQYTFCSSCGKQIKIDDGTIVIKKVDVDRLKAVELDERKFEADEARYQQQLAERQEKMEYDSKMKQRKKNWFKAVIAGHLIEGLFVVITYLTTYRRFNAYDNKMIPIMLVGFLMFPIILTVVRYTALPKDTTRPAIVQCLIFYFTFAVTSLCCLFLSVLFIQ